jgi:hypothetical protein
MLARWGFVGFAVCAAGCGGNQKGNPPASGADLAVSATPADLAVTTANDLAVTAPTPGDLAVSPPTSQPDLATPPADMTSTGTPPPPDMTVGKPSGPPTFSADVLPILQNNGCLSHHMTGAWNPTETQANSAAIVAYLTATASSECGTNKFVIASDATNSYMYQKLSGNFSSPCSSDPMPPGSGPIPTSQSDVVKAWINAGALAN